MNTSATGGYLTPDDIVLPESGDELDKIFQWLVKNITGLKGDYVRPRWQPKPPKQLPSNVDWCSLGVTNIASDYSLNMRDDELNSYETLDVLLTFYGPNSMRYASIFRDGIQVPQNNEVIRKHGIVYHSFSNIRPFPEFVNGMWIKRYDLTVQFKRKTSRKYQVKEISNANIKIGDK